jgi:site-specific DNA-cytosine methylase
VRDSARLPLGLDSARYRALGNAVTVSVAYWIAERIVAYETKTS